MQIESIQSINELIERARGHLGKLGWTPSAQLFGQGAGIASRSVDTAAGQKVVSIVLSGYGNPDHYGREQSSGFGISITGEYNSEGRNICESARIALHENESESQFEEKIKRLHEDIDRRVDQSYARSLILSGEQGGLSKPKTSPAISS